MKYSSLFRRYGEMALGAGMLALASFYLYNVQFIKIRSNVSVSARLIPEILGILVIVLGLAQIYFGYRHWREISEDDRESGAVAVAATGEEKRDAFPVAITFALIIGYAVAFEPLGFIIASVLFMFLQMMLLTPKSESRPVLFFIIAALVSVIVYIAFRRGLNLSLPQGLLEGLPI